LPLRKKKDQQAKEEFDVNRNLNVCVKTGKVVIGEKAIIKHLGQETLKLIIFANNTPEDVKAHVTKFAKLNPVPVPLYKFIQSSIELGTTCGKPFMISALGVVDEGDSEILKAGPQF